jgi:hypothetical protein
MKTYEVEMASTTYRTFEIEADSPEDAQNKAFFELDADWEISKAWRQNAEVVFCEPKGGTSHMDDDEFGAYIRGESVDADTMDYDGMGNHKR